MANNTYVALDKVTVGTAVSYIDFTGISSAYTDLVIVANGNTDAATTTRLYVGNGSINTSTTDYSWTVLSGTGSVANSYRDSSVAFTQNERYANWDATNNANTIINLQNYSNTTTNKTWLSRGSNAAAGVDAIVGLWRSTSAINVIRISCTNAGRTFSVGATFSLYGILAEGVSPTTKATGGAVYSDSTYYYHVFGASGTFTPTQSITADYLVVAGGGGGTSGGGGAGGLRSSVSSTGGGGSLETALSLSASAYTITVGGGGTKGFVDGGDGVAGTNGGTSSIAGSGITTVSTVGGGAGGQAGSGSTRQTGANGGSGGGAAASGGSTNSGGSPTANEGFSGGGNGGFSSSPYGVGGGGGAGGAATTATSAIAMPGGAGLLLSGWATATGTGVNKYYAGGGAGGAYFVNSSYINIGGVGGGGNGGQSGSGGVGSAGVANTGSGGGGGGNAGSGGNGASGLVIIRYAK